MGFSLFKNSAVEPHVNLSVQELKNTYGKKSASCLNCTCSSREISLVWKNMVLIRIIKQKIHKNSKRIEPQ